MGADDNTIVLTTTPSERRDRYVALTRAAAAAHDQTMREKLLAEGWTIVYTPHGWVARR